MESINGILLLSDTEKATLEAFIGPISSYEVNSIRDKLELAIAEKEREGYLLWARIISLYVEPIRELCGDSGGDNNTARVETSSFDTFDIQAAPPKQVQ